MAIIQVDNLSKCYNIGLAKRSDSLREQITHIVTSPIRNLKRFGRSSTSEESTIWALRDVSFSVEPGEAVGIIGKNGSGKSTLLKILSRITEPTSGHVRLYGKVGSLLEVGTGFHPELTGRENIFLSGAIIGIDTEHIGKMLDEIVDFSGIESFIDTPVKRYSSGMRVRLGFAVASHLDANILLVDEVLAVGDIEFQKKCLSKMSEVGKSGRTVFFVSHNMSAIMRLCNRALLLKEGRLLVDGSTEEAIDAYYAKQRVKTAGGCTFSGDNTPGDDHVRLRSVTVVDDAGAMADRLRMDQAFGIEIAFEVRKRIRNFHLYIRIFTENEILALGSGDWDLAGEKLPETVYEPGLHRARVTFPPHLLNLGQFSVTVEGQIPQQRYVFQESHVVQFSVSEIGGVGGAVSLLRPGIFRPALDWRIEQSAKDAHPAETREQSE